MSVYPPDLLTLHSHAPVRIAMGGWRIAPAVESVRARLDAWGVRSWLVGGAVRDALLGREAVDIDIAVEGRAHSAGVRLASDLDGAFVPWAGCDEEMVRVVLRVKGDNCVVDCQFCDQWHRFRPVQARLHGERDGGPTDGRPACRPGVLFVGGPFRWSGGLACSHDSRRKPWRLLGRPCAPDTRAKTRGTARLRDRLRDAHADTRKLPSTQRGVRRAGKPRTVQAARRAWRDPKRSRSGRPGCAVRGVAGACGREGRHAAQGALLRRVQPPRRVGGTGRTHRAGPAGRRRLGGGRAPAIRWHRGAIRRTRRQRIRQADSPEAGRASSRRRQAVHQDGGSSPAASDFWAITSRASASPPR